MPTPELLEQDLIKLGPAALSDQIEAEGRAEAVDQYLELASQRMNSSVSVAEAALTLSEHLTERMHRPDALPQVRYLQARLAVNGGRPDEALTLINEARDGWLGLGRPLDAYRTDLGRMHVLDDLGRHRDAVATGESLIVQLERTSLENEANDAGLAEQISWLRAAVRENLGAAYGYTGQHAAALEAYQQAELGYGRVGDTHDVARCRANRGVELMAVGQAGDGLAAVAEAAGMFNDFGDSHSHAKCLGHWAEAELLLGRYADCLARFAEARRHFAQLDARAEAARLAVKTMRAYLALNLDDEAAAIGDEAESVLAQAGLVHDLAEVRWLLAATHLRNGRPDQALLKLDEAVAGARASEDQPLTARVLVTRSEALSELGHGDQAILAGQDALDLVGDGSWPVEEWDVRIRLSQVLDGPAKADHLAKAGELAEELGLPHLRYVALLETGRHQRAMGEEAAARRSFEDAVKVVEGLRGLIPDEAVRTSFVEGRTAAYSELIAVVMGGTGGDDHLRAFELAEASKARTLADMISATAGRLSASEASQARAASRQADLDACYSALIAGGSGMTRSRRDTIQHRAVELETLLSRTQLEAVADPVISLDRSDSPVPTLHPRPDEQVVEYHVVDSALVAFVWSGGELQVVTDLATTAQSQRLLADWERQRQRYLNAKQAGRGQHEALQGSANATLQTIWARLFAPVAERLTAGGQLLIIPHGPAYAIPFHALPGPDQRVGETWTVVLAPSYRIANRLDDRGHGNHTSGKRSLVVGVADKAAPEVATESKLIAGRLTDAELLLNSAATIETVKARLGAPHNVVHIACHGLHRTRNPMFSALKLADGWLTAHDVLSLNLDHSLVVLSACESGRHSHQRRLSEPVGLARSFLAAGARAVVVSLWLADDQATAETMTEFYRQVNLGLAPAQALQSAQASVAVNHPHPAAWAPFVIHGGSRSEGER